MKFSVLLLMATSSFAGTRINIRCTFVPTIEGWADVQYSQNMIIHEKLLYDTHGETKFDSTKMMNPARDNSGNGVFSLHAANRLGTITLPQDLTEDKIRFDVLSAGIKDPNYTFQKNTVIGTFVCNVSHGWSKEYTCIYNISKGACN